MYFRFKSVEDNAALLEHLASFCSTLSLQTPVYAGLDLSYTHSAIALAQFDEYDVIARYSIFAITVRKPHDWRVRAHIIASCTGQIAQALSFVDTCFMIEDVYLSRNTKTLKQLAYLQGAVGAMLNAYTASFLQANEWRSMLGYAGVRTASAKRAAFNILRRYGVCLDAYCSDDDAEALAIAVANYLFNKNTCK